MYIYLLLTSLALAGCVPVQRQDPRAYPGRDPFLLGTPDMDQFTGMSGGGGGVITGPRGESYTYTGQGVITGPRGEAWTYTW
jgi:hypothetical protein